MQDDILVSSSSGDLVGEAAPPPAPEETQAPEAAPEPASSEPVYTVTVGTVDSPMYVHVVNADAITAPLLVPLALIIFAVGISAGAALGKALNWWKW